MNDGSSIFFTIAILFGVGFGIVRWMPRIRPLEVRIRNWAIGLGIVSGFVFFFADPFPSRRSSDDLGTVIAGSALIGAEAGGCLVLSDRFADIRVSVRRRSPVPIARQLETTTLRTASTAGRGKATTP